MARLNSNISPVLSDSVVAKLHSQNVFTVYDCLLKSCDDLMRSTGLSFKEIESLRESCSKTFGSEVENPLELLCKEIREIIRTGINNLDYLLEGGFHCGQIYELCGTSSAGKSQLCHWMSMHATLNASTEVYYLDTSRNFYASRIQMMLEARQCDDNAIGKVMSSIKVYHIHKIDDLFTVLHYLSKLLKNAESRSTKKIVVVDSISALCTLISNTDITAILCNVATVCKFLVNHSSTTMIIVNTVKEEYGERFVSENDDKKVNLKSRPSLGYYWRVTPNVRLLITQLANGRREISVWNSNLLEDGKKCYVNIKDGGIFDT